MLLFQMFSKMADEEDSKSPEPSDPLSFFTAGDDSSDSDSDEDGEGDFKNRSNEPKDCNEEEISPKSKLPSPHTLFATVGRPAFLETKEESDLDWNSLSKRYEPSVTYTAPPVQFSGSTEESEEYSDAIISSAPIKYKREASEIQKHLLIHHKRTAEALKILDDRGDTPAKQQETSDAKKQKTETFRQKEKRKRDLEQASRGKSYVEEEKRILRQDFGQ